MVREALFSILGDAVPERPFYDVFAGTGVNGFEALSRGASETVFVERDFRLISDLERHLKEFSGDSRIGDGRVIRADVYRWIERWQPPPRAINVFFSPPFADFERRPDEMLALINATQERLHPESVLVVQAEPAVMLSMLPRRLEWDERKYGRNILLFWVKPATTTTAVSTAVPQDAPQQELPPHAATPPERT
jgi:16S rRNA (guanine(966)-N(2))-methyltransferase RsmD